MTPVTNIQIDMNETNRLLALILEHLRTTDKPTIAPEWLDKMKSETEDMKWDIKAQAEACVVKTDGPYPFLNPLRILSLDIAELKKEVAESTWDHLAVKLLRLIEIVEQLEKRTTAWSFPGPPLTIPFPPTAYPALPTIPVIQPPYWMGGSTICLKPGEVQSTNAASVPDASGTSESPNDYGSPF